MIFIGFNHNDIIISIISCETEKQANAYWQGKGVLPHRSVQFDSDEQRENEKLGFITPILTTKEKEIYEFQNMRGSDRKFVIVTKN